MPTHPNYSALKKQAPRKSGSTVLRAGNERPIDPLDRSSHGAAQVAAFGEGVKGIESPREKKASLDRAHGQTVAECGYIILPRTSQSIRQPIMSYQDTIWTTNMSQSFHYPTRIASRQTERSCLAATKALCGAVRSLDKGRPLIGKQAYMAFQT
ncbi:hypothetical protein J1614_007683 [Plenodomus biglobosus]|nr:hypothetical protein J1614_007683 [Plenodomus biglobosus]